VNGIPAESIFVNVQPLSGAAANNAVYEAFLQPGDPVVGLDLSHGGHLTHGSPANRSGKRYRVTPYHVNPETGKLDYEEILRVVKEVRPRLLIGGASAYPYDWDWPKMRAIAEEVGAILLADISHPAGLVAAGVLSSPVGQAHVVSMTTHKTLCGPRGAILLSTDPSHARAIDSAVFPGEQGGPHLHQILAKAVCFLIAKTEKFRACMRQVATNARVLCDAIRKEGLAVANGGGTESHLFTVDLKGLETKTGVPLSGDVAANLLDLCHITLNKNTLPGDTNAARPSGLRIGTVWITQRGLSEGHMKTLAGLIARVLKESETFEIEGGTGPVGRARLAPSVLAEVTAGARKLAGEGRLEGPAREAAARRETPLTALHRESRASLEERDGWTIAANFGEPTAERASLDKGAALFDASDRLLFGVRGERAWSFMSQAFASRIPQAAGEASPATMLSPSGETVDEPVVLRMPRTHDGDDDFWVFDASAATLSTLEGISDGFVRFDSADLAAKIDGPVAIEDLRTHRRSERRRLAIVLAGPKAAATLKAASPALGAVAAGRWAEGALDGASVVAARPGEAFWYLIVARPEDAPRVWAQLKAAGAVPAGVKVRDAARRDSAKPDMRKPYFIGVRALTSAPGRREAFVWRDPSGAPLKKSCLHEEHLKLTKKRYMVPFAGWEMPVLYTSILDEHEAVRTRAGLFDITHMGTMDVSGPYAERFLDLVTTNFVAKLRDGQTQYSYVLDHEGRVLDDILVYRRGRERFLLVVNASNADKLWAWFTGVAGGRYLLDPKRPGLEVEADVTLRNLKDESSGEDQLVDVAVQGPKSLAILQRASDGKAGKTALRELRKSDFFETTLCGGIPVLVSKTGYTGENTGFELYVHPDRAAELWTGLRNAGEKHGLTPCGLGARDSTRTEAGFPLYGHELAGDLEIIPLEAGYGAFVKRHKPCFAGRDGMIAREEASKNLVVRFRLNSEKAKAIRPGDPVVNASKGAYIGKVTSCTLVGKSQIGLAYVDARFAKEGTSLAIFPLSRHEDREAPGEKAKDRLGPGDRVTVPELATVMERFAQSRGEMEEEE
jgi:glycine cleavage system T protein